jgi:hypothetical protein
VQTQWSVDLHESEIAYSIIESAHLWSQCAFGTLLVLGLRSY